MKIALMTNNYPPEFLGGTERVVRALAQQLRGVGEDVVVISGSEVRHAGADVVVECDDDIPVLRVPRRSGEDYALNLERPRVLGVVQGLLEEHSVDVVHVHHWSHLSDGLVRAAHELGKGCVVTLHDVWTACPRFFRAPPEGITCPEDASREACIQCVNREFGESTEWVAERMKRRDLDLDAELRLANSIYTPSESCRQALLAHLPGDHGNRIDVLPHGLLDESSPPERGPLGLPLRIGTFGNLNREKGVLDLVTAMRSVRAELHLHGAASGEFEAEVRARAAELDVHLTWHGAYDASFQPATALDLAVFPSRCAESYGLVVDEALHCGTPVVVSDGGALPERIDRGGGVAFPAGDAAALGEVLKLIVDDRDSYHQLRASIPTEFPTLADAMAEYRHAYSKAWAAARAVS